MGRRSSGYRCARATVLVLVAFSAARAEAADILVPAGGDLQAALNVARPGDTVLLAAGATYVGNFTLPVHGGTTYVTLRTAGGDALLPGSGTRITPAHAPYLAKLRSPNVMSVLRTAPGAAYWRILLVEFLANEKGAGDILQLGIGSSAQNSLALVPHHLTIDRVYMHGDLLLGQKRGIALNSAHTTIVNSHIDEMKGTGQDTQAIAGWNGPGPYHIENNHLEAAGEVVIFGGDDPKIPGLVPSDLLLRGNTLRRPVGWREPIVPSPAGVAATDAAGALAPGTYAYRIVARRPAGSSMATSARSLEVTRSLTRTGGVTITWSPVPHATEYRVYGRAPGAQSIYWTVRTTSFTDSGLAGTAGTPPSNGTVWLVKNLFELKNCRRARIEYNLMENNWAHAQTGIAVLLTPRNQYGTCPQCVVEDVVFERNVVRNTGGGLNILGRDYNHESQQTNNIRVRNNIFAGVDRAVWGGSGYFLTMTQGPRDVVIDHNTIVSPNGLGVISVGDGPVIAFVFTNNVARHNSYGIMGSGQGYGNAAISHYFPDGVFQRNVLAGGKASMYPASNLFPTVADFEAHFVNYAAADYLLRSGTDWAAAGTDGRDLGANPEATAVASSSGPAIATSPLRISTTSLASAVELQAYLATLVASGGSPQYSWSIAEGVMAPGIALDPKTGVLSGKVSAAGEYTFTVRVGDAKGEAATQRLTLRVDRAIQPVEIATATLPDATASIAYAERLAATGGLGTYTWRITAGTPPAGIALDANGELAGSARTAGTATFTVTAFDSLDLDRRASRTYALRVLPVPNAAPVVTLRASAAEVHPVGAPVTLTARATDADGVVTRVDFFVNGVGIGSRSAPPFEVAWTPLHEGTYTATAVATDDRAASGTSDGVALQASAEVVINAPDVVRMVGDYQLVEDPSTAAGRRLWNPNRGAAKLRKAQSHPAHYAEFTFYAEAGRAYRIWVRGAGERNKWSNDSAFFQFSGTVDAAGVAVHRIGTLGSIWYSVEEYAHAGLKGWGWQDNGYGQDVAGAPLYFAQTGPQTIRIQPREDGLSIDQIVISPGRYLSLSPGLPKDDATFASKP